MCFTNSNKNNYGLIDGQNIADSKLMNYILCQLCKNI